MPCRIIIHAFALLAVTAASASAQFPSGTAPVEGLLLLKNGETLAGSITRSGDYYVVATPESEVQIRFRDAHAVCRDMAEAFQHKAVALRTHSPDDRLTLAQWCIDRKMFDAAARELTEAYRLDDLHPRIPLLELRLRAAMAEPKPSAVAPRTATTPLVPDDVLDQTARSISPVALHEFTTRIQPLLVNYCATAGCHGPRPVSNFHLHRVYLNERNDPRLVKLNLHAVMAQIDRETPASSRMLMIPLAAHGGATKPLFHAHNAEHYRMLATWVMQVASSSTTTAAAQLPASTANVGGALMQRLPLVPPTNVLAPAVPEGTVNPMPATTVPSPTAVAPPTPASADPFDPAAFNRRRESAPLPTEADSQQVEPQE